MITTEIFAIYPLVLVIMLILFGNVSDCIGRRSTLLIGLSFLLIGTMLFPLAPGFGLIFTGRIVQGIGVGLVVGAGNAALVDYNPYGPRVPGSLSTAAGSVGFTLALVVGAVFVQYIPDPLHLSYWVLVAAFVVAVILTAIAVVALVLSATLATPSKPKSESHPPVHGKLGHAGL